MKVLIINAVYKNFSTGRGALELHDYLKANGHSCFTVYGGKRVHEEDCLRVGNRMTQAFHGLLTRITGKIGYYSKSNTKKIIKVIKEYKPDVVQLGNLHANFISIPLILKYLGDNGIPTVTVLDDCFYYTGGCTHYTANGCFKWKTGCKDCKFNKRTWFFDKSKKMFDDKRTLFNGINRLAVVGVSDWITEEAKLSPLFSNAKIIKRIYNGVDLDVFKPQKSDFKERFGLTDKKVILGVASGWSKEKGLDTFCRLADKLREGYAVVLVGGVAGAKLPDNIIHIEKTDDLSELVDIYCAADVFLQASPEESFGKVVAEALACGVPVVTNDKTANPELVGNGCGAVVHDFTTENIAVAIDAVTSKNGEETLKECRKRAEDLFDRRNTAKEYLRVFKDITG